MGDSPYPIVSTLARMNLVGGLPAVWYCRNGKMVVPLQRKKQSRHKNAKIQNIQEGPGHTG